jgi:hypothetical protein
MEMAMSGVPVITAGLTHYRGKGFTHDPDSFQDYLEDLTALLHEPAGRRLPQAQVELAWRYAQRFFFEYPFEFPWHLIDFWQDLQARPFEEVINSPARSPYASTLRALAGDPIDWSGRGGQHVA